MQRVQFISDNDTIRGVLFEPTTPPPHPAIIFAHGLLSAYQEFGDYPERFCQRGYVVLAFDFRGHGMSEGMRGLISEASMVEDLRHALDYIEARPEIDNNHIALFGHSLGGGGVVCATARDTRVQAVVAGATVGRVRDELKPSEIQLYRVVDTVNRLQKSLTKKSIYVPYRVSYKDIFADPECAAAARAKNFLQSSLPADNIPQLLTQNAIACAQNIHVPALIVQGELDQVVAHTSVQAVYDAIPSDKELYIVKGSGHSVWTDCKGDEAFEHVAAWLDKHLQ